MSLYAIGDVQGCLVSLENLLKLINYKKSDHLIFLGDIVNRGRNSLETVRFLKELNSDVVLGNHDLHTIGVYYGVRKISKSDTIDNLIRSPDADSLIHWLKSKPLFLKKYNHTFVHAGINPLWSLNQCINYSEKVSFALIRNPENTLKKIFYKTINNKRPPIEQFIVNFFTRVRYLKKNYELFFRYTDYPNQSSNEIHPWYKLVKKNLFYPLIFGHWSQLGLNFYKNFICLDSGCVWGGKLTALRIDDYKVFQVKKSIKD